MNTNIARACQGLVLAMMFFGLGIIAHAQTAVVAPPTTEADVRAAMATADNLVAENAPARKAATERANTAIRAVEALGPKDDYLAAVKANIKLMEVSLEVSRVWRPTSSAQTKAVIRNTDYAIESGKDGVAGFSAWHKGMLALNGEEHSLLQRLNKAMELGNAAAKKARDREDADFLRMKADMDRLLQIPIPK